MKRSHVDKNINMDVVATELIGGHHLPAHKLEMEGLGSTILNEFVCGMELDAHHHGQSPMVFFVQCEPSFSS